MSIQFVLFALIFIAIGLALDGAFFWRFTNMLGVFRENENDVNYAAFAFPRLVFIAISSLIVALGSYPIPTDPSLIVAGCIAFMVFSFYPHIVIYLKSKRIK